MADTAPKSVDVTASPDSKKERAGRLLEKWCRQNHCEVTDIPHAVKKDRRHRAVGTLVYALRNVVELPIFPTAELLGIHPSEAAILCQAANDRIKVRKVPEDGKALSGLLSSTEEGSPNFSAPRPLIPSPTQRLTRAARTAEMFAKEAEFAEERRERAKKVCELAGEQFEETFKNKSTRGVIVDIRYLALAIVYALDQTKNCAAIGRSLNVGMGTFNTALNRIDTMVRNLSGLDKGWREKILLVCAAFDIPPERLQISNF